LTIRIDFFESNFDFKYRNRLELLISTLEIELPRFLSRVGTNRQDSNRFLDPNSMTRTDAINLLLKEHVYKVNSYINDVIGDKNKIKEVLFDALYKAWEALDEYSLHDLV